MTGARSLEPRLRYPHDQRSDVIRRAAGNGAPHELLREYARGLWRTKFRGQVPQPENPWLYMVGIIVVFGIVFMLGEIFIKKNND